MGPFRPPPPSGGENIVIIFNVKNMLNFEQIEEVQLQCTPSFQISKYATVSELGGG